MNRTDQFRAPHHMSPLIPTLLGLGSAVALLTLILAIVAIKRLK